MRHLLQGIAIVYFASFMFLYNIHTTLAEPASDDTANLLQKSLTLYEIDQEIARLDEEQKNNAAQITLTQQSIGEQNDRVKETGKHAGKVLRAYYMGERSTIWMALLSVRSFSDALIVYEYLNTIIENDHRILQNHSNSLRELQSLQQQLTAKQDTLAKTKAEYTAQRERQVNLQKELDAKLAGNKQADLLREQMEQLTAKWQQEGQPVFKTYFQALSAAMKQLPDILTDSPNNNNLVIDGFNYTFQISDVELNHFLRKKNPLFKDMTFHFKPNEITAEGKQGDIALSIKGHYILTETPKNAITFLIDELSFNGYTLDDTTYRALEKEFDLSFYPQKIAAFVSATGVSVADGKMLVELKLSL